MTPEQELAYYKEQARLYKQALYEIEDTFYYNKAPLDYNQIQRLITNTESLVAAAKARADDV